jgi:hypothetical protein
MADSRPTADEGDEQASADGAVESEEDTAESTDQLRQRVEEAYDFDDFGPADMAEMTLEEWEAAFDPDSWVVGPALLDRVEAELKSAVARRDVFAKFERFEEGGEELLAAYSDEGYAVVYPDGSVEGRGTVLRDVKPVVALCSMEEYEVTEPPEAYDLPDPTEVPEGSGEFGNLMLQVVAAAQILVGVGLFGFWLFTDLSTIVAPVLALAFVLVGFFLFLVVANARLSDRFRAEEYRNRLRAVGVEDGERPAFLRAAEEGREDGPAAVEGDTEGAARDPRDGPGRPARDRETGPTDGGD